MGAPAAGGSMGEAAQLGEGRRGLTLTSGTDFLLSSSGGSFE